MGIVVKLLSHCYPTGRQCAYRLKGSDAEGLFFPRKTKQTWHRIEIHFLTDLDPTDGTRTIECQCQTSQNLGLRREKKGRGREKRENGMVSKPNG